MAKLLGSAPYFPVVDVARTADHYQQVLGFSTVYRAGEPTLFAMCERDGYRILLRRVDRAGAIRPVESQGGTWDAFFWVDDANALYRELKTRGAEVVYGPVVQEYGMLEFAVRDSDGHVLGFGQNREDSSGEPTSGS